MKRYYSIFLTILIFFSIALFTFNKNLLNEHMYGKLIKKTKTLSNMIIEKAKQKKPNTTIFCFILTYPKHFSTFTKVSYESCFKHCTDYRFATVYDKKVEELPYKFIHPKNWTNESYKLITDKIYDGFLQTINLPAYDWFVFTIKLKIFFFSNGFAFFMNI